MSAKLELYQAIKIALEAISGIEEVIHYNGQDLLNYEKDIGRRFPQCWIQLTTIPWQPSQLGAYNENRTRQQKSTGAIITIFTAQRTVKDDDDTFEIDLVFIDLVYRALTLLDGDHFSPLERLSESDLPTNSNIRVWAQEYTTMLTERANASTLEDAAPVTLVIDKAILP